MSRVLKWVLAANVLVAVALVFLYPHLMISPGKLIPGHQGLETDCFACHTPFSGATSSRCQSCHRPEQIGRFLTTGQPLNRPNTRVAFHQQLLEQDCVACHSDHAGVKRFRPQGRFQHGLLQSTTRDQCQQCHRSPTDGLHQRIAGNCQQCHAQERWTPATFEHDAYFELDRDHRAPCATCHPRHDYARYTCYGCHEHSPASIRREHIEEGIRNFDRCVDCHRNANEHDIRGGQSGASSGESEHHGRQHGREHDD